MSENKNPCEQLKFCQANGSQSECEEYDQCDATGVRKNCSRTIKKRRS